MKAPCMFIVVKSDKHAGDWILKISDNVETIYQSVILLIV
jgi:hypothetical protein